LTFKVTLHPPQGPMDPRAGRGTSADIIPTQIKFVADPSTRCWDIAQKPPKCKNFLLTPTVTKISFPPFFANPQKGRRHIRNQSAPACKIWVVEKSLTKSKQTKKHTVKHTCTSPILTSEWRVNIIKNQNSSYDCCV